ncbi:MAG TPA: hypothetical protein VLF67_03470 [Candidatus Saccharimonas sp.]|nr:hypothetical protein [Candidatus Saccharimonas sp.]
MDSPDTPSAKSPDRLTRILRWVVGLLVIGLVVAAGLYGTAYTVSPSVISHPTSTHEHLRLQIVVGGHPVNFGDTQYQTEFNKDICTAALTEQPIHFHDHLDQFVHLHWAGITGGLLLKDYGWDLIGGANDTLGYRFDHLPVLSRVPIHGHDLPTVPAGAHYYVYTGTATNFHQRNWSDFLHQSLHQFLSGTPVTRLPWWASFTATASAHGDDEQLTQINHVIGNVVIFVQSSPPSQTEVQDRLNHLIDLPDSACGG